MSTLGHAGSQHWRRMMTIRELHRKRLKHIHKRWRTMTAVGYVLTAHTEECLLASIGNHVIARFIATVRRKVPNNDLCYFWTRVGTDHNIGVFIRGYFEGTTEEGPYLRVGDLWRGIVLSHLSGRSHLLLDTGYSRSKHHGIVYGGNYDLTDEMFDKLELDLPTPTLVPVALGIDNTTRKHLRVNRMKLLADTKAEYDQS